MKQSKAIKGLLIIMTLLAMCGLMAGCSNDKEKDKEENKSVNAYETPISNYFEGIQKASAKTYSKAYPDFYVDYMGIEDDDMEKMCDSLEDKYGIGFKISYEIKATEDIKSSDLENVEKYIKQRYKKEVEIAEGKEVKVKATIEGKDDSDTDTSKMYVYKIDGEWKLFDVSPSLAKSYAK